MDSRKETDVAREYIDCRLASVQMCKPLEIEDYVPQPVTFVSSPKWNLAHTSWFFEELILKVFKKDYDVFHPQYSYLFNSYYNAVGERVARANRGDLSRSTVSEVYTYRAYVDENMLELLANNPDEKVQELCILGINHEQQHQELFYSDLKYVLHLNPLFPVYSDVAFCENRNTDDGFEKVEAGLYKIGYDSTSFHYDNEKGRHQVWLDDFGISKALVTNGDYLEFIHDKGYERFEFWYDEALFWKRENSIMHPMYWHQHKGEWYQFTLSGLRKLNTEDILCHVSYYEAFAFAQWKGMRLPTEFEWEAASVRFSWGSRWEWTESAYLPYPGYNKATGAIGEYNGKFMVNQKLLRGASVVTPAGHERNTYRNFWHPDLGHQYNGIRLVK